MKRGIILITIIAWVIIVALWGVLYITSNIELESSVGYEKDWVFQLAFFGYSRIPWLFLALLLILVCETIVLRRKKTGNTVSRKR